MLLSGSTESAHHNWAIEKFEKHPDKFTKIFCGLEWLHALSGSIESDNHNGAIE